jgi:hypothetical protein
MRRLIDTFQDDNVELAVSNITGVSETAKKNGGMVGATDCGKFGDVRLFMPPLGIGDLPVSSGQE